jgi:ubiquinone/menaquinone biosynthesis C-methylase UbiE
MKIPDERPHLEEVREFYAEISYEYDGRKEAYFVNLFQLFARCLREIFQERRFGGPFDTVLDAGCGTGSQVLYAANFCRRVIGVDLTPEALQVTARKVQARRLTNVRLLVGDVTHLSLRDESCDCVLSLGDVIGHIPNYEGMLAEVARVSKPGALFCFECENKWYPGLLWDRKERRAALKDRRKGHPRVWEFQGKALIFNSFGRGEIIELLAKHGFQILDIYGFDFFTYLFPIPEKYQFSDRDGWREKTVHALGKVDLALTRHFPVNRFGYSEVIFARKVL